MTDDQSIFDDEPIVYGPDYVPIQEVYIPWINYFLKIEKEKNEERDD